MQQYSHLSSVYTFSEYLCWKLFLGYGQLKQNQTEMIATCHILSHIKSKMSPEVSLYRGHVVTIIMSVITTQ